MRQVTVAQRRRLMVRRHHLVGDARDPMATTRAVVALHATDPASVYLSVLARCGTASLDDVADAMYGRRCLVRWMAMRRTLFVFDREDIPTVQAARVACALLERRSKIIIRSSMDAAGGTPPVAHHGG